MRRENWHRQPLGSWLHEEQNRNPCQAKQPDDSSRQGQIQTKKRKADAAARAAPKVARRELSQLDCACAREAAARSSSLGSCGSTSCTPFAGTAVAASSPSPGCAAVSPALVPTSQAAAAADTWLSLRSICSFRVDADAGWAAALLPDAGAWPWLSPAFFETEDRA